MKSFSEYYEPQVPIERDIDALSDPKLDHERNRDDVNKLLMNLALKYAAKYLQASPDSIGDIERRAREAVTTTPEDIAAMLFDVMAKNSGIQSPGEGISSQRDILAVECLTDLRSTAAIMKEIIFGGDFQLGKSDPYANNFIGLDLGHGTGILTLATYIAARRKEIDDILVCGFDISPVAVKNSARVLYSLLPESKVKVGQADITLPELWWIFSGGPLNYLVTETIGPSTPKIVKKEGAWTMENDDDEQLQSSLLTHSDTDPFADVFFNALNFRRGIENDIAVGSTAMFPDIINGRFRPDSGDSTLSLKTGTSDEPLKLHDIGREFNDFQELQIGNHRRWQEGEIRGTPEMREGFMNLFKL